MQKGFRVQGSGFRVPSLGVSGFCCCLTKGGESRSKKALAIFGFASQFRSSDCQSGGSNSGVLGGGVGGRRG